MPWLPAPGARELLRPGGTAGQARGCPSFPGGGSGRSARGESPVFPQPPAPFIASNTRSAARLWPLARSRFASGLRAASGALFLCKTQGLSPQRSGGKSSPFRSSSFSLPKQAYVPVSPAGLSLALPAGLRNFCRWPLIYLFFSPGLYFIFPPVISHSPQSTRTGRLLPFAQQAGHGPSGGQRRSAPASPSLAPPGAPARKRCPRN